MQIYKKVRVMEISTTIPGPKHFFSSAKHLSICEHVEKIIDFIPQGDYVENVLKQCPL